MKRIIGFVLAVVCMLGLVGCNNRGMNYIIEYEPSVTGVIEEIYDDYIIVFNATAEGTPTEQVSMVL